MDRRRGIMSNQRWRCIDAGSEYCPCYLAETMDCITCSHLKGKEFCDCDWRGVCIYQAYTFEGSKKKDPRESLQVEVTDMRELGENILELTIKVPHTLARQLNQPGSYVFIRNENYNQFFDIPISVMHADIRNDLVKLAIEVHGIKTKTIKSINKHLLMRGPYWNGIFGLDYLKQVQNTNCLVIVRGIAQAPSVLVIKHLLKNNNSVDLIIDTASTNYNFIKEFCNVNELKECNLYESKGIELLNSQLSAKNYELIFLGTSDYLRDKILPTVKNIKNYKIVTTNNNEICCGEGICGSCTEHDMNGIPIRTCKTQFVAD